MSLERIGDTAPHNAFTDLVRWRDRLWCTYREGAAHVSPDGALRILVSPDGVNWSPAARITSGRGDLRDPHFVVTPDDRLMLYGAVALPQPGPVRHQSLAWFSEDGIRWSDATDLGEPNVWLWRIDWNGPQALGVGYDTAGEHFVRLYSGAGADGRIFKPLVQTLFSDGQPNEAGLAFLPDGTALCLLRRDGQPGTAQWGRSPPPYRDWTWRDLGVRIGGPQLLRLPDGRLVAGVRLYDGGARTALCWLDPGAGALTEFLRLPGSGDCSYPGLVWWQDTLWVSYYASHEGATRVYLARVRLPMAGPAKP
ncbi:MAG: exo-alpha-sialidase [Verrucomicrobia bacterium]|nr:exo-alpha-sialidase [Verrucomicrobiota bacterium]